MSRLFCRSKSHNHTYHTRKQTVDSFVKLNYINHTQKCKNVNSYLIQKSHRSHEDTDWEEYSHFASNHIDAHQPHRSDANLCAYSCTLSDHIDDKKTFCDYWSRELLWRIKSHLTRKYRLILAARRKHTPCCLCTVMTRIHTHMDDRRCTCARDSTRVWICTDDCWCSSSAQAAFVWSNAAWRLFQSPYPP